MRGLRIRKGLCGIHSIRIKRNVSFRDRRPWKRLDRLLRDDEKVLTALVTWMYRICKLDKVQCSIQKRNLGKEVLEESREVYANGFRPPSEETSLDMRVHAHNIGTASHRDKDSTDLTRLR